MDPAGLCECGSGVMMVTNVHLILYIETADQYYRCKLTGNSLIRAKEKNLSERSETVISP
jgi:hypothetical protein